MQFNNTLMLHSKYHLLYATHSLMLVNAKWVIGNNAETLLFWDQSPSSVRAF